MDTATRNTVTRDTVSAVFDNERDAQGAIDWLRDRGVPQDAITVVARNRDGGAAVTSADSGTREAADDASDAGKGALTGLGIGAGVGALFGLAAAAIPGVGPFIAAGALAQSLGVTAGAAVSGAIVGGVSGGIASALSHWGLNEAESSYYAGEVERGGTFVSVDARQTTVGREAILDAFRQYHGRFAAI